MYKETLSFYEKRSYLLFILFLVIDIFVILCFIRPLGRIFVNPKIAMQVVEWHNSINATNILNKF